MTAYEKSPWMEAILTVNGKLIKWNEEIVLLRGKSNQFSVEVEPEIAQSLQLELVEDGGVSVAALPAFGTWNHPVKKKYSWTITPETTRSGLIKLVLISPEETTHWELPCRVVSSDLADEVAKIQVNGNDLSPAGFLFFHVVPGTVTVVLKDGSPLAGHGLELRVVPLTGLSAADLDLTLKEYPLTWELNARRSRGAFVFELVAADVPTTFKSPVCKVMSRDVREEIHNVRVDGEIMPSYGERFFRNQPRTLTPIFKDHSPLKDHPMELIAIPLTGLEAAHLEVTQPQPHNWAINAHTNSGTFQLVLKGADMLTNVILPTCKVFSTNLADEGIVMIDGVAATPGGTLFYRDKPRTLTLALKGHSPLAGHPVTLRCSVGSGLLETDVVSQPRFGDSSSLHSWTITGSNRSGAFSLILHGGYIPIPITLEENKLL